MENENENEKVNVTEENKTGSGTNTTVVVNEIRRANSLGTAGFVLALIALFFSWIPIFGWIVWALGAVFSIIGIFKIPRGLAIAGAAISFAGLIILIAVAGTIAGTIGCSSL
ncbi:MAG: hypothetical protein LBD41_05560 [Clostridiales Family XIII bacterium]|jgi:hypothetical protein|nr:hypothetical protein [Clostridiales Family XIII bacterium]